MVAALREYGTVKDRLDAAAVRLIGSMTRPECSPTTVTNGPSTRSRSSSGGTAGPLAGGHRGLRPGRGLPLPGQLLGIAGGGSATALTATGAVMGTLDYMAPEQFEGRPVDHRVDIYALGCLVYESLRPETLPRRRPTRPDARPPSWLRRLGRRRNQHQHPQGRGHPSAAVTPSAAGTPTATPPTKSTSSMEPEETLIRAATGPTLIPPTTWAELTAATTPASAPRTDRRRCIRRRCRAGRGRTRAGARGPGPRRHRHHPVGANPTGAAVTPDGRHAYITNYGSSSVSVIDIGAG